MIPFRYIAGGWHPDHDTLAHFRKTFLVELGDLFAQVLVVAHELGLLKLGNISLDESKVHAEPSKSHAVRHGRLLQLERRLRAEVEDLMALGEKAEEEDLPEGLDVEFEIALRQESLLNLDQAKAVLEARAQERHEAEKAEHEAKLREREEKAKKTGRKPRGKAPKPPTAKPRAKEQYNFTDPDSRIMNGQAHSTDKVCDRYYNVQVAVDQDSRLIAGHRVSNHVNDQGKRHPLWMPIRPRWESPRRPLWTMVTGARPRSRN